jgi:glycosyltransferase involved in cell wall biosynthesis
MAKGIPVISTRFGEAERAVDDGQTGFLCDSREELAAAFERLALDSSLRESMGRRARTRVEERYSLARAGEKLESILTKVVSCQGASLAWPPPNHGDMARQESSPSICEA